ncbi:MAG: hypothetical protein JWM82_1871 [Myxococcales bacterium]|nr:hypothetical protein [Myxococcales bacterium]
MLLGFAFIGGSGARDRLYAYEGIAGLLSAILTVAYVIFLRMRKAPLTLDLSRLSWLRREVPRAPEGARLLRWRHLIHDGTILELASRQGPLLLGVTHRLAPPSLMSPWRAAGRVDAILSPADFSDLLDALGVAHLGWVPPRRMATVLETWLSTIGTIVVLALAFHFSGLGDRSFFVTFPGRVFVSTVTFAIVALGFVLLFTRGATTARTRAPLEKRPASREPSDKLWRNVTFMFSWQFLVSLTSLSFAVPVVLSDYAFRRWGDTPACRADCAEHHRPFTTYSPSKTGHFCLCGDLRLPVHYTLTGGHSVGAELLDFTLRTPIFVVALLLPVLFAPAALVLRRRRPPGY